MSYIVPPLPVFTDREGKPLEGGFIFVGEAPDARDNPIAVYWDEALTIPAAQPIRTLGGYPTYQGMASQLWVNQVDCLITVCDRRGEAILVNADAKPFVTSREFDQFKESFAGGEGSALVGFRQSGAGAIDRTVLAKTRELGVSVKDFGAIGDGIADDTAAIQKALDAHLHVLFPPGKYLFTSLTLRDWQHISGSGFSPTIAVGGADVTLECTLTSGTAITCGYHPTIEYLSFVNTGGTYNDTTKVLSGTSATAIVLTDNMTVNYCTFSTWFRVFDLGAQAYYIRTNAVEFNRCSTGYDSSNGSTYDLGIYAPISRDTTTFFRGSASEPSRDIKIFGGSIEGYSTVAVYFLDLSLFGVYFETIPQRAGAFAIDPSVSGASVSMFGCTVYMNHTARFVNFSGLTYAGLVGSGNRFDGHAPSGAIIYYMPADGTVSLFGDRFGAGHPNDVYYVSSIAGHNFEMPALPAGNVFAAYSGMRIIGSRGSVQPGLSAEPPAPRPAGMVVTADGSSWDPLSRADSRPYQVIWRIDGWGAVSGL